MFNVIFATLMLPIEGLAPANAVDIISTNQKYENHVIKETKQTVYSEIAEFAGNSRDVIKALATSFILNDYESHNELLRLASALDVRPSWLLTTFYIEKAGTLSTSIRNPFSNAVGLIGFMPRTAERLGTCIDSLSKMTFIEQSFYIEKYIISTGKSSKIDSYTDLYLAVFYPVAVGKSDAYLIGKRSEKGDLFKHLKGDTTLSFRNKVYYQNRHMDIDKDGKITVKDVKKFANKT